MSVTPMSLARDSSAQTATSVADLLLTASRQRPTAGCHVVSGTQIHEGGESLSYGGLLEEARRIAQGLATRGLRDGDEVALLLERLRDFIPAFWACIIGGYVPCLISPSHNDRGRWLKHITHVHTLLDRPLFVCRDRLRHSLPNAIASVDLDDLRQNPPRERIERPRLCDSAVLVLTSGSTGISKAVALTHGNLLASMRAKVQIQQLTAEDVTLNWISFDHVAALLEAHMLPLSVGANQFHVESAEILADPLLFLRLIDQFRVSMTFAPNFLFGQINAAVASTIDKRQPVALNLSCLRHIISGGEANVVETCQRFLDLLEPYGLSRHAVWPAFGMTETCAGSIYSREFPEIDTGSEFASVGVTVAGLEMRVVADAEVPLPAGTVGELQLRGEMIFPRYHNDEHATRAAFTADGWFRTGDLGRINDGRLTLVGRKKDSIIVSGANYPCHELETTLEQLAGVDPSFVAAFATRPRGVDTEELIVAFATTFSLHDEDRLYQLIAAIRNTTIMLWGFKPSLVLPLPRNAFQKTSLGKIQRTAMRERLEGGEFAAAALQVAQLTARSLGGYTPPQGQLEREIVEIFAAILALDERGLSATANLFDLGGTSLNILKVTQATERRYQLQLTLTTILQNPTPRQLAAHVDSARRPVNRPYDPIVPLQLTGSKTPLFCIPPGNGGVLIYVNLAKYFVNERPVYALRPRGFDADESCFETFEEMESAYLEGIRRCQPHGPYAILGYSLGGPIAFEIAKKLRADGESVAFLGCIDYMPLAASPQLDLGESALNLGLLLNLLTADQVKQARSQLAAGAYGGNACNLVLATAPSERIAELSLDLAKYSAWASVVRSLLSVCSQRDTSGSVETMTLFCAGAPTGEWPEWTQRWNPFVRRLRCVAVSGTHLTLMGPQHVSAFQAVLRAEIDAAFASDANSR